MRASKFLLVTKVKYFPHLNSITLSMLNGLIAQVTNLKRMKLHLYSINFTFVLKKKKKEINCHLEKKNFNLKNFRFKKYKKYLKNIIKTFFLKKGKKSSKKI